MLCLGGQALLRGAVSSSTARAISRMALSSPSIRSMTSVIAPCVPLVVRSGCLWAPMSTSPAQPRFRTRLPWFASLHVEGDFSMDVVVWEAGTTSLTLWALLQVDVGPVRPILMTAVISLTPKPVDVLIVVGAAKVCLLHDDLVIAVPVAGGRGR